MTMYLPNPDVHPTGSEPAEFIEVLATGGEAFGDPRAPSSDETTRARAIVGPHDQSRSPTTGPVEERPTTARRAPNRWRTRFPS